MVIHDTGAYTLSMWSRHCSRGMPRVLGWRSPAGRAGADPAPAVELALLRERERPADVVRFWSARPAAGPRHLALTSLLVSDYDEAIAFFVDTLGFELAEDRAEPTKRWVVVRPPGAATGVVLAVPSSVEQEERVGSQLGGRVGFFLHTDDFARDHARMTAAGVRFREEPRHEAYGIVAVWEDPWGNPWDLLEPA
ncbi:MAG: VOC family protein [Acidimicrobiales bacterium]